MKTLWVDSICPTCSRRSIVHLDIHTRHGTSYLAALTQMTQLLTRGMWGGWQRGSRDELKEGAATSFWEQHFDWRKGDENMFKLALDSL